MRFFWTWFFFKKFSHSKSPIVKFFYYREKTMGFFSKIFSFKKSYSKVLFTIGKKQWDFFQNFSHSKSPIVKFCLL
jgi:hypothetical protein